MEKHSDETKFALIQNDIAYIKESLVKIEKTIDLIASNYLSKAEFDLFKNGEYWVIRTLVYGSVATILTAVTAYLLKGGKL